jgi:hypothetical protein
MYEIWYIPRIQDELVVARFETEDEAKSAMTELKAKRPKAYPHHYIWDVKNKTKLEERNI